ncbi:MAG: tetratricopeptide repeat protein [Chthoniobacterales bacterium]
MKIGFVFSLAILTAPMAAPALDKVDKLQMDAQQAFEQRDYDAAIRYWSDAIELSPKEASIYINRAAAYAAQKEPANALADYTAAIRIDPNNATARKLRAELHREEHESAAAISDYSEWVRIQLAAEKNPKAFVQGLAKKSLPDTNYELAAACWSAILKMDPGDSSAWFQRAVINELLQQPGKALADCNEALRRDPKNADAAQLRAHIDAGWKWEPQPFNQQNTHEKAREYDKAVADYSIPIWLSRSFVLDAAYRRDLADCSAAVCLNGKFLDDAYALRARNYAAMGQFEKAVADYTEAIGLGSAAIRYEYYKSRGMARVQMKDYDKAAADFAAAETAWRKESRRESDRSADDKEIENGIASQFVIRRADALVRGGRYGRAMDVLKKNLATDAEDTWTMNALAWLYATCPDAKFRNGGKALALAKRTELGDAIAAAYAELGRWDDAIREEKLVIKGGADEEDMATCVAHLALYEQKKPCREWKDLEVGD